MKFYVEVTETVGYIAVIEAETAEQARTLVVDQDGEPLEETYETYDITVHGVHEVNEA